MAIDIEFEWQAMFNKSGRKEIKVGQEVFGVVDLGAGANARAIVQQIEQRIVSFVAWEPTVGSGVQLPERADLEALPTTDRCGFTP